MLKSGTRIEVSVLGMGFQRKWEPATIARRTREMAPPDRLPGYHPVRFDDGGVLMIHESGFRVVDNRPQAAE